VSLRIRDTMRIFTVLRKLSPLDRGIAKIAAKTFMRGVDERTTPRSLRILRIYNSEFGIHNDDCRRKPKS